MKKTLFMLVVLCMTSFVTQAQGLYVKLQPGYGFSLSSSDFPSSMVRTTNAGGVLTDYTAVNGSLGKGFNVGLNLGYMLGEHFGIELGLGYNFGGSYEITSQYIDNTASPVTNVTTTETYSSHQFRISPALVLTTGGNEGIVPYAKLGVVLGLGSKVTYDYKQSNNATAQKLEYTGSMPIGFNGAFGANYFLGSSLSIFGEFEVLGMAYSPSTATLVESKDATGASNLGSYTVKEWELVDKYSTNSAATAPGNQSLTQNFPFSSIGINIGLRMSFGGR